MTALAASNEKTIDTAIETCLARVLTNFPGCTVADFLKRRDFRAVKIAWIISSLKSSNFVGRRCLP